MNKALGLLKARYEVLRKMFEGTRRVLVFGESERDLGECRRVGTGRGGFKLEERYGSVRYKKLSSDISPELSSDSRRCFLLSSAEPDGAFEEDPGGVGCRGESNNSDRGPCCDMLARYLASRKLLAHLSSIVEGVIPIAATKVEVLW